ncbi:hypothetical protein QQZ08_010534 [Neonectria magnoliae]|uniref:Protein kinase domain-containing protein n=1 Tax=Neonectria magnoliae TaxID=2732573 RepID=A0ABR1HG56_9HYPO
MSRYRDNESIPLDIIRHNTGENDLQSIRNFHAVQSALLRGDKVVTLHNTTNISNGIITNLEREYSSDHDHTQPYEWEYRRVGSNDPEDHISEDQVQNKFADKKFQDFKLEFLKLLGAGGYGVAALWKAHFEGGITQKLVIKVSVADDFDAKEERDWHQRYGGSRHTVQPFDLAKFAGTARDTFLSNNPGAPLSYGDGSIFDQSSWNALFIEHMNRGDLIDLLRKVCPRRFPDGVLWGMWECLVKGAAAVAFQPTFSKKNQIFEQEMERAEAENCLGGFLQNLEKEEITHDVHLDLDESNILIGDDDMHPNQPVFKFHDFGGFSYKMDEEWKTHDEEWYWTRRTPAKPRRMTPEQVHEDWDELSTNVAPEEGVGRFVGDNLTRGNRIAGRFGVWTNIFSIAKTMEAIMTHMYIAHPFSTKSYTTINGKTKALTYGWRLNKPDYEDIDPLLRDVVCRCLFEQPIDRPNIVSLLRSIERRKQHAFKETAEEVKNFWQHYYAPQPPELIQEPHTPRPVQQRPPAPGPIQQQPQNHRDRAELLRRLLRQRLATAGTDARGYQNNVQRYRAERAMERAGRVQRQLNSEASSSVDPTPSNRPVVSGLQGRRGPPQAQNRQDSHHTAGTPAQGLSGNETTTTQHQESGQQRQQSDDSNDPGSPAGYLRVAFVLPDQSSKKPKHRSVSKGTSSKKVHSDNGQGQYPREHTAVRLSHGSGQPSGSIQKLRVVPFRNANKVQKKSSKRQSKPKKIPQSRSKVLKSAIDQALPQMPVAIQNLAIRSKQLEERLRRGLDQTSGWGSGEWLSQELIYEATKAALT